MSSPQETSSIFRLKTLLRQTLRITISDGRIFLGTFAGTDKQLNILLVNTDEFRFTPLDCANPDGRFVGLVMIPRRFILKIETNGTGVSQDAGREMLQSINEEEDEMYT